MNSELFFRIAPSEAFLLGCAFQEFRSTRTYAEIANSRTDRWDNDENIVPHTKTLMEFLRHRLEPFIGPPCTQRRIDLPDATPPDDGRRIVAGNVVLIYSNDTPAIIYSEVGGTVQVELEYHLLGCLANLVRDHVAWRPIDDRTFPQSALHAEELSARIDATLARNEEGEECLEEISAFFQRVGRDDLSEVDRLLIELVNRNECSVPFDTGRKFGRVLAEYYQDEMYRGDFPPNNILGP